ncbi:reverse transcriptase domain-containing protein [Tanacetum coccineum]
MQGRLQGIRMGIMQYRMSGIKLGRMQFRIQNANQNGNGNVVAARAKSNGNRNNKNQVRCYNCRGMGHLAKNCTVKPRRKDAAYLQTQLLIARKEEAGIQLQAEEFDLMAVARDIDEIEETDQLSMEHSGRKVEQHTATIEETRAYFESSYNNLVTKVEKVNTVNRKMKQANADLTTELARYKGQEKSFEINKAKFDELETGYRKSVYQEQCLTKKINALHLSSAKQITTLNKEIIKELDNILVKTGQSIQTMHMLSPKPDSFYHTEQKMDLGYQNPFYLKQAQQKQQSLYNGRVLLEKHDHPAVYDLEETLQLAQESRQVTRKGAFLNTSKMASVSNTISKSFSIPDDDFSDDTPSVAQKFLNEYKKCKECKYDKISYDKAYNNMQHPIERLQAQLGDLKGKSIDTKCASDTLDPLSQKLEDENVSLEF